MKQVLLIIGAILFSTLFYKQNIGLNLSIFSIFSTMLLVIHNKTAFNKKSSKALALVYIITALAVFFYRSSLSIIANGVAFLTLIGHISEQSSSIYINWLNGFYTSIAGFIDRYLTLQNNEQDVTKKQIDYLHLAKIIGIPLIVTLVFIGFYKNGNPVFGELISKINFGFINIQWLLLSIIGYLLFNNISKPVRVEPATSSDINIENNLVTKTEIKLESLAKENQLGFIMITLLNVLIAFFLITDITYLVSSQDFRASAISNQVHSGINALIASIIFAIIIILYFFRGHLNFYKANKNLKIVTYAWIVLNALLVINIAIKDCQYIYYFGLTYKRIGVLIYLILTVIGLITTAIKVKQVKNLWYLLRLNTITAFAILIIASTINWDNHITNYNLYYAQSMDFKYLIKLSDNNTFLLKNYAKNTPLSIEKKHICR